VAALPKWTVKDPVVEKAMCVNVAMLASTFLTHSSVYNAVAPADHCVVRVSEVVDWEGLGRTDRSQTERIFAKELLDRPTRPLGVMQRGRAGVCFVDAHEISRRTGIGGGKKEGATKPFQLPPPYGSVEHATSFYGECHASIPQLWKGTETVALLTAADEDTIAYAEGVRVHEESVEAHAAAMALVEAEAKARAEAEAADPKAAKAKAKAKGKGKGKDAEPESTIEVPEIVPAPEPVHRGVLKERLRATEVAICEDTLQVSGVLVDTTAQLLYRMRLLSYGAAPASAEPTEEEDVGATSAAMVAQA
jgi:hypothetical protein